MYYVDLKPTPSSILIENSMVHKPQELIPTPVPSVNGLARNINFKGQLKINGQHIVNE